MADAISVRGLTKFYGGGLKGIVAAVDNISFSVAEGEVFGFIGPNGAGKTTTIKILLGLLFPSAGEAEVLGKPAGDIETKRRISYLPESPYFYEHMTGAEVIDFYCRLFRMNAGLRKTKTTELLKRVGLASDGDRTLRQYSKGMLQRIGIAQALINDPDLLFLDEPTSGLDPIAHKDITELIASLGKQGKTVFLSSHQLGDVETVCDRVAIINRGKIVKIGTLDDLLHAGRTVVTLARPGDGLVEKLKSLAERVSSDGELVRFYVESEDKVHSLLEAARGKATLVSVVPQRQTLEDLFVEIVREVGK
ncbi:MAG: ABC transporter ATP-binding protein [Armatimonadetes bacterium]|nr:ABC transporter ATP-binding protein [Armatimonadota bacterium]